MSVDTPSPEPTGYDALSSKRRRFVDEYFVCGMVAWKAYVAAGYGGDEPDRRKDPEAWDKWWRAVRANSSRLIADDNVSDAVAERVAERAAAADEVLALLADQARASLAPFVRIDDEGRIRFDFSHPDAAAHLHLIKKVKTKTTRTVRDDVETEEEWVEVELHSSQGALRELARILGLSGPKGTADDPIHHAHTVTDEDRQRRLAELRRIDADRTDA